MIITKTIKKEEIVTIEIETPTFYKLEIKYAGINYYQVNSALDVIEVQASDNFNTVQRLPLSYIPNCMKIFDGEVITECEFNEAISEAISTITSLVPGPLLPTI